LTVLGNEVDVHREIFGFELAFLDGNASIGMRIPYVQAGSPGGSVNAQRIEAFGQGFLPLTAGTPTEIDDFGGTDFQDISIIFKYALINNRQTGNVLSAGLVVTVPTGSDFLVTDGRELDPALVQPFLGYFYNLGRFFLHGFSSIAVPTDDRDVTLLFNDIGLGWWMYQGGPEQFVSDVIPTVELHVNTPLTHRGSLELPVGTPDQIDVTGGVILAMFRRASWSLGAAVPVSGPRPFDIEAFSQVNIRF
jgi:hypothetical protein